MAKANLQELVEAFELQGPELSAYLNLHTGQVVALTDEEIGFVDRDDFDDETPSWMKEAADLAKAVIESGDYMVLPHEWDLDEYRIMASFGHERTDEAIRESLLVAMRGKGAFRRFEDTVFDLGIRDEWFKYRDACFKDFAIEWCQAHDIEIME